MSNELEILQSFIPRLSGFYQGLQSKIFEEQKQKLNLILPYLIKLENENREFKRKHLPDFNILEIMRYGNKETRLHTPFLRYLLDPNESHYLDIMFAVKFIGLCYKDIDTNEVKQIEVWEEKYFGEYGRIDLFIRFSYKGRFHFIAVENKLDAVDQKEQLTRYYNVLLSYTNDVSRIRLIYLTKYGRDPNIPYSISIQLFQELSKTNQLIMISYKIEITSLVSYILKHYKDNSMTNNFTATLNQYHKIISNF